MRVADRYPTAFVTGASGGLGRGFAEMLLAEGVRVWGTSRDVVRLTPLAAQFPALFTPVVLDLEDTTAGVAGFRRAAKNAGGSFDLVVNNAGYGVFAGFTDAEFTSWDRQLQAMLLATMQLGHEAMRAMRSRGRGCLVNISSLAVEFPLPFMAGYNVAKAGLSAFSESLMIETRGTPLTVIDFRPGDFRTDFNRAMQSVSPPATAPTPAMVRVWAALEKNLQAAPPPTLAARDLRRALLRGRSGTVRSGSWFQAGLAAAFAQFAPQRLRRTVAASFFGL